MKKHIITLCLLLCMSCLSACDSQVITSQEADQSQQAKVTLADKSQEERQKVDLIIRDEVTRKTILSQSIAWQEGLTAWKALLQGAESAGIVLDYTGSDSSVYVKGIGNRYEFDVSPMSGWTYEVNSEMPSVGAGSYNLKENDQVTWVYKDFSQS